MKCPKCGYNSFEYLDSCKKCNSDLVKFKESFGIRGVIIPLRRPEVPAPDNEELVVDGMPDQNGNETFIFDSPPPATSPSATAEDPFSSLEPGFPAENGSPEREPCSSIMDVRPEPPAGPSKAVEMAFGELSFQDIANTTKEKALQAGNTDSSPTDEMFADLLEASNASGSQGKEGWTAIANEFNPEELQQFEDDGLLEETGADAGYKQAASVGEFEMDDFVSQQDSDADSAATAAAPTPEITRDEFDSLFGDTAPLRKGKRA